MNLNRALSGIVMGILGILVLSPKHSFAQQDSAQNVFFSFGIDDILNLEPREELRLSTASRFAESVEDAPSSVTVFTRAQIQAMGIENLFELLNFVPGFQVTRIIETAETPTAHIRGRDAFRGLLLLINGQRLTELYQGSSFLFTRFLTTGNIKQVEVVRGPASALYGSNAFLGVVNIITEDETNELAINVGSQQGINASMNISKPINNKLDFTAFAQVLRDEGFNYTGANYNTNDPFTQSSFYTQFRYNQWQLTTSYGRTRTENFLLFNGRVGNEINKNTTNHWQTALSYDGQISERTLIAPRFYYTRLSWEQVGISTPAGVANNNFDFIVGPAFTYNEYEFTLDLISNLNKNNDLLVGVGYRRSGLDGAGTYTNHISPDGSAIAPRNDFYIGRIERITGVTQFEVFRRPIRLFSAYAQYKLQFNDKLMAYAEARYDNYFGIASTFNPHMAIIYRTPINSTIKLVGGTAFRVPSIAELYADTPVLIGNQNIQPENTIGGELIYMQRVGKANFELIGFINQYTDLIGGSISTDNRRTFVNVGEAVNTSGIEFAAYVPLGQHWQIHSNFTYLLQGADSTTFGYFGSTAINYRQRKWNLNLSGVYRPALPETVLANQPAYALINSRIQYAFSDKMALTWHMNNLLNERYLTYSPRFLQPEGGVPNRGRWWRVGVLVKM
ncbi:TonB-dependent receptor plug domain-containing protein [Eisenibacter elegans]|uniref:TonB-dependent receptor plug domain-containing protein n=1 Tax=Eisenibacter elegans TaxID=997 RepID=UPI00047EE7DF|nr:TonB-dependent receptor [Eisenibacter elegans]